MQIKKGECRGTNVPRGTKRKGKCYDIRTNILNTNMENTGLIGMTLRQFPAIIGEGGRISSLNGDISEPMQWRHNGQIEASQF